MSAILVFFFDFICPLDQFNKNIIYGLYIDA